MTEERVTPLRQRMIEDMRIRGMGDKAQKSHIRVIKDFAVFLGRNHGVTATTIPIPRTPLTTSPKMAPVSRMKIESNWDHGNKGSVTTF